MNLKSINYWSYEGGMAGTLPVEEFLSLAKAHNYQAVELCIGDSGALHLDSTEGEVKAMAAMAMQLGLRIPSCASGLYWAFALADSSGVARSNAKQALEKMVLIAGWLGAETLLTIPGSVDVFFNPDRPVQRYDEVMAYAREGIAAVLPAAEKAGVRLGIENVWNKFLLSPLEMAALIDGFNSSFVGAYVDVANILPYGYPEQWLRILGKRVVGVHFKDFRRAVGTAEGFVDLLEGDVNWPEVMAAIKEIGYEGPVVAELIPLYRHYAYVRGHVTSIAMDAILGR